MNEMKRGAALGAMLAAFALAWPCSAVTNNLTYVASLGRFDGQGGIETYDLTGTVDMTVTLYGSDADSATPLWSRRMPVDVQGGHFAIELSDTVGQADLSRTVTYSLLSTMFESQSFETAYWVGLSDLQQNGSPLPEVATSALKRGKLSAVPFAIQADRAQKARGNFTVGGNAAVTSFRCTGNATVKGKAVFRGATTFDRSVTFRAADGGSAALTVTGKLQRATLDGVGTLKAGKLTATGKLTANVLTVADGDGTTLTPAADKLTSLKNLTVSDTFQSDERITVGALSADELNVDGTFTLPSNAALHWSGGTLTVPDGVFSEGGNSKGVNTTGTHTWKNPTGRGVLAALTIGKNSDKGTVKSAGGSFAILGGGPVSVTTLVPLSAGESLESGAGAITRSYKELSK